MPLIKEKEKLINGKRREGDEIFLCVRYDGVLSYRKKKRGGRPQVTI